jgi:hypothetical protein
MPFATYPLGAEHDVFADRGCVDELARVDRVRLGSQFDGGLGNRLSLFIVERHGASKGRSSHLAGVAALRRPLAKLADSDGGWVHLRGSGRDRNAIAGDSPDRRAVFFPPKTVTD